MQEYKKKMFIHLIWTSVAVMLFVVGNILLCLYVQVDLDEWNLGFLYGFQSGLGIAVFVGLIASVIQYFRAVTNEQHLKKLYIKEHDERMRHIREKSASATVIIVIYGLAIASVLAGYLNTIVFFTLIAACLFVGLIHAGFKLYYCKRY